jgi:hypothetical protein
MQSNKRISKPLPSLQYLREAFAYDPEIGLLMWKDRPVSHFKCKLTYSRTNALTAGTIAGSPYNNHRVQSGISANVCINNVEYTVPRIIYKLMTGKDPVKLLYVRGCTWPYIPFKNIKMARQ